MHQSPYRQLVEDFSFHRSFSSDNIPKLLKIVRRDASPHGSKVTIVVWKYLFVVHERKMSQATLTDEFHETIYPKLKR